MSKHVCEVLQTCPTSVDPENLLGFIDNITFHPVPEPGTLALLSLCLAALGVRAKRT